LACPPPRVVTTALPPGSWCAATPNLQSSLHVSRLRHRFHWLLGSRRRRECRRPSRFRTSSRRTEADWQFRPELRSSRTLAH